jgi:hypothetical protein
MNGGKITPRYALVVVLADRLDEVIISFGFFLQGHKSWLAFKDGYPSYLEEMDRMYEHTVDGSTSFVPAANVSPQSSPIRCDSSSQEDDAQDGEDEDQQVTPRSSNTSRSNRSKRASSTPHSNPSKRTSSNSTTAHSPRKRSQSPVVSNTICSMNRHNEIMINRNELMSNRTALIQDLFRKKEARVQEAYKLAAELGVSSATTPDMFRGLMRIVDSEQQLTLFLTATADDRRFMLTECSRVDN